MNSLVELDDLLNGMKCLIMSGNDMFDYECVRFAKTKLHGSAK